MERNIKVFRTHRALSWLYLVSISLLAIGAFHQPELLRDPPLVILFFLLVAVFSVHYLIARGAKESKPWSRVGSIVVSVFLLFGFPIGTLIAVYLLANTWQPWSHAQPVGA